MVEIKDFIDSANLKEKLKDAYNKKYHFQWIGLSHMYLDTMLKMFFYTSIAGSYPARKFRDDQVDWMKKLSFWNVLNVANIFGLLSDKLFDNLKELNQKRNLILHNLILKNEDLNTINLEKYYNLTQETIELLVFEWLEHTRLQSISKEIFDKAIKKFEDKFKDIDKQR